MKHSHLLSLIADRCNQGYETPACVDSLRNDEVPILYFHDVPRDEVCRWTDLFKAVLCEERGFTGHGRTRDFTALCWHGKYLDCDVKIKLFERANDASKRPHPVDS